MPFMNFSRPGLIASIRRSVFSGAGNEHRPHKILYSIILVQFLLLAGVALWPSPPVGRLFRDPLAIAEEYPFCCHVYDGLFSNMGVLLWWTAAVAAGFAALVTARLSKRRHEVLVLSVAAGFSAWLALDDLFMLHEKLFPKLGLSQPEILALYGVLAAVYIAFSWRVVLTAAPLLLLMGIGMLGLSGSFDILADHDLGAASAWLLEHWRLQILLEDGAKFLGIGFWCCLHLAAAMNVIVEVAQSSSTTDPTSQA